MSENGVTLYGGTNYIVENTYMQSLYFSMVKSPHGFPMSPDKWSERFSRETDDRIAPITNNVWKPSDNCKITVPTGDWKISNNFCVFATLNATESLLLTTLSSNTTTATNPELTAYNAESDLNAAAPYTQMSVYNEADIRLNNKTVFTVLVKVLIGAVSSSAITLEGSKKMIVLKAVCAYL